MVKKLFAIFCAMMLPMVSRCSFFAPSSKTVRVPARLEVKRNENLTIIAHKKGFAPYKSSTGYSLSTTGTLDAIGCWLLLLPGAGLLAPGDGISRPPSFIPELKSVPQTG